MTSRQCVAFLVFASSVARAQVPATYNSVAVFSLTAEMGTTASAAKLVTERVAQLVRDSAAFPRVVTASELETMVSAESQKQAANCTDESCLRELAGALNVDLILTGSVGYMGKSYLLNLKLLDARRATALASVGERYKASTEEQLLDHIEIAVWQLLQRSGLKHQMQQPPPVVEPAEAAETPTGGSKTLWKVLAGAGVAGAVATVPFAMVLAVIVYAAVGAVLFFAQGGPAPGVQHGLIADGAALLGGGGVVLVVGLPVFLGMSAVAVAGLLKGFIL
jgi:hypothetical protein